MEKKIHGNQRKSISKIHWNELDWHGTAHMKHRQLKIQQTHTSENLSGIRNTRWNDSNKYSIHNG